MFRIFSFYADLILAKNKKKEFFTIQNTYPLVDLIEVGHLQFKIERLV